MPGAAGHDAGGAQQGLRGASGSAGAGGRQSRSLGEVRGSGFSSAYVEQANGYIRDVLSGKLPACKWAKAACLRQQRDLGKQQRDSFPFRFDSLAAARVCEFVEQCRHIKGPLRGQRIQLEPWQCFILTTAFGWIHKRNHRRRFRRIFTLVPRGNAKSTLSSALALYMTAMDDEGGSEVYSAATTRDQSRIVFGVAQAMARLMPDWQDFAGVSVGANSITQLGTASYFRPLSSEADTLDGLNVHFGVLDELHAHRTREVYDVLDTATNKRAQGMLWCISTAGVNITGVCYQQYEYVQKLLDGVFEDESFFGIIYTVDEDDEWSDESSWIKANPNWGVSVFADDIGQKAKRALQLPSLQAAFKTKHLNIWCSADSSWMDMQKWALCADPKLTLEEFAGQPCILGLDLASKLDLLALVLIFWKDLGVVERDKGGKPIQEVRRHYYVFGKYWVPEARLEDANNSHYEGWRIEGQLETCRGETNDYDLVEDAIREYCKRFQVLKVAHDPYQAVELVNHLQGEGILMVEIPQVTRHLSEPMKEIEAAVYDRRLHHDGDPVMKWGISNVVAHRDRNDNLFPNKPDAQRKIDPATALMTGLNQVMAEGKAGEGGFQIIGMI